MTNKETATALFLAARFIGKQEDNEPWLIDVNYNGVTISRWFYDDIGSMTTTRRALGGKWDKVVTEYAFSLVKSIGENVTLKLETPRSTACTPRVVGTETIEVKDYSDVPTKTIERDIVEWDCNPVLDDTNHVQDTTWSH